MSSYQPTLSNASDSRIDFHISFQDWRSFRKKCQSSIGHYSPIDIMKMDDIFYLQLLKNFYTNPTHCFPPYSHELLSRVSDNEWMYCLLMNFAIFTRLRNLTK